jgi:cobalt-zinc-cadmium efflux system outer membrane protein
MKKLIAVSAFAFACAQPLAAQEAPALARLPDSLRPYIDGILADHPRNAAGAAAAARARADAEAAGQYLYNPELELDSARVAAKAQDAEAYDTNSIALRMTVDITGKSGLRGSVGTRQAEAAEAETLAARMALAADIVAALNDLRAAGQRLGAATRQSELADRFLSLSERRHKAGELPAMDLNAAQLAAAEAASTRQEAELSAIQAEEALRAACLCEPAAAPPLPADLPPPPKPTEDGIEAVADQHPAVQAARRQVQAARDGIELARAQRVPDPTFRLGGSKEGEEKRVMLGLSIPIPVLNSGAAEVAAAGRALAQAEATERQTRLETAAAIRSALRSYQRAVQSVESWQRLGVPSLERQAETLTRLWRAGELSATDFLVQMRETARANTTAIDLRANAWAAYAQLLRNAAPSSAPGAVSHE